MYFQFHFIVTVYVILNSVYVPWQRYRSEGLYKHARTHKPRQIVGFFARVKVYTAALSYRW
jgi:hypothetical protein